MHKVIICSFYILLILLVPLAAFPHPHIIDTNNGTEISANDLLADLRQAQVIFIGEFHDHRGHHQMQLDIIDALDEDPTPLAVGLEMFRRDSQDVLDKWVNNELPMYKFHESYQDNWSMWPVYQKIFVHAHLNQG